MTIGNGKPKSTFDAMLDNALSGSSQPINRDATMVALGVRIKDLVTELSTIHRQYGMTLLIGSMSPAGHMFDIQGALDEVALAKSIMDYQGRRYMDFLMEKVFNSPGAVVITEDGSESPPKPGTAGLQGQ